MKRLYGMFLVAALSFWGCDSLLNGNSSRGEGLEARFELRNGQDQPVQVFRSGEAMKFYYALENHTGEPQTWITRDARPFVTFEVVGEKGVIWNSTRGFAFAQVIIKKEMAEGGQLTRSLTLTLADTLFSPGTYTARALPELDFEKISEPPVLRKSFAVKP